MTDRQEPDPGTEEFLAWLESVPDAEQAEAIRQAMEDLQARTRRVAQTRSALMRRDYRGSYDELAQGYGVSRQRAHQIVTGFAASAAPAPATVRRPKDAAGSQNDSKRTKATKKAARRKKKGSGED